MRKNLSLWIILILLVFDGFVWFQVVFGGSINHLEIYGLNIGQGDAELIILPGGAKVLIDGGPSSRVVEELSSILGITDRYIDLIVLSHPQLDHFAGLIDVFKTYKVGAFVSNGRSGKIKAFLDLARARDENKIQSVVLGEGDKISYLDSDFEILSPSPDLRESDEPNDTTLVMKLTSAGSKTLFTGDIDSKIEERLMKNYDLDIDILKVAHHGSRFSSSAEFLKTATPKIAFIEVGKNNYGHPTKEALERLKDAGTQIFRVDQDGAIKIAIVNSQITIGKKK